MYKEAQAAPLPLPIGSIRAECDSCVRSVCKICALKEEMYLTHSEAAWGIWYSQDITSLFVFIGYLDRNTSITINF
jgi:hypothetical protein